MRLLHSTTFQFSVFDGEVIPPYAILSHTWAGDSSQEVSFQEMSIGAGSQKPGYQKIRRCGEMAATSSLDYFWVDTCCIDKSSSAELSEAINSMYRWYKRAEICYAYLSDVLTNSATNINDSHTFENSRWFTRGWTLQELLAPSEIIFFSREWEQIGTKQSLRGHIKDATRIDIKALDGMDLRLFSVAQKMSWAAERDTTRVEDMAYSLMGIFDVSMPLLYGEREKAFMRLQEEILKITGDQSLLAWKNTAISAETYTGLLASSPKHFAASGNISSMGIWGKNGEISFTHKGIGIDLFLVPYLEDQGIFRASLDCRAGISPTISPAIYLKQLSTDIQDALPRGHQFCRIQAQEFDLLDAAEKVSGDYSHVFVKQNHKVQHQQSREMNHLKLFRLTFDKNCTLERVFPPNSWDPQTRFFHSTSNTGKIGALLCKSEGYTGRSCLMFLGFSALGFPGVYIKEIAPGSGNADEEWSKYKPNNLEEFKLDAVRDIYVAYRNDTHGEYRSFTAKVSGVEMYGRLVFTVHVSSEYKIMPNSQAHRY